MNLGSDGLVSVAIVNKTKNKLAYYQRLQPVVAYAKESIKLLNKLADTARTI